MNIFIGKHAAFFNPTELPLSIHPKVLEARESFLFTFWFEVRVFCGFLFFLTVVIDSGVGPQTDQRHRNRRKHVVGGGRPGDGATPLLSR